MFCDPGRSLLQNISRLFNFSNTLWNCVFLKQQQLTAKVIATMLNIFSVIEGIAIGRKDGVRILVEFKYSVNNEWSQLLSNYAYNMLINLGEMEWIGESNHQTVENNTLIWWLGKFSECKEQWLLKEKKWPNSGEKEAKLLSPGSLPWEWWMGAFLPRTESRYFPKS